MEPPEQENRRWAGKAKVSIKRLVYNLMRRNPRILLIRLWMPQMLHQIPQNKDHGNRPATRCWDVH